MPIKGLSTGLVADTGPPAGAETAFTEGADTLAHVLLEGGSLSDALSRICAGIDSELGDDGVRSTVCLIREGRLSYVAGPGMPGAFWRAVNGLQVARQSGACGRAATLAEPVFVADVLDSPAYARYRELIRPLGVGSVWAVPVLDGSGQVLATVSMHFPQRMDAPPEGAQEPMQRLVGLVRTALVIEELGQQGDRDIAGLLRYIQGSSIGCIEWDPDFRIRFGNPAAAEMFSYLPDHLIGMTGEDFLLHDKDRKGLTAIKQDMRRGGMRHMHTYARCRRSDGVPIWVEWFNLAVTGRDGRITGFLSLLKDVTESTLIRRYMDRVASLPEAGGGWSYLDHLVEQIRSVMGADAAVVASVDASRNVARVLSASARGAPLDIDSYALAGTPCAELNHCDACVINHEVQARYPDDELLTRLDARSYAGVRLRDGDGRSVGLLAVVGRHALGPVEPVQRTLEHAAVRIRLELQRLWAERDTRLAALAFETHEAIMILDRDYRFVHVNDAFSRMTGYPAGAVVGHGLRLLLGGRRGGPVRRDIQETVRRNGRWHGEVWARSRDGGQRLYRLSLTALEGADDRDAHFIGSFLDVTWHREAEERIHRLTFEDGVTGLPNRASLLGRLARNNEVPARGRGDVLMVMDLDGFRRVNEGMGYETADSLLEIQAARLRALVPGAAAVARVGADEFAVLLSGATLPKERKAFWGRVADEAERLRRAFLQPVEVSGTMVQSGVSIGVAVMEAGMDDPSALLGRAEIAAGQARHQGGNGVAWFAPEMEAEASERRELERALRQAVDDASIGFCLQPLVNVEGGITALEVLARWEFDGEPVSPAKFIPIAEASGLIRPLGAQILRAACRWLADWHRGAPERPLPALAVNVSVRQFHDPDFETMVAGILEESGLPPRALLLEVTESLLADEGDGVVGRMNRLRDLGVRFAIDDFGTGYSCLAYLRRLPIDELKIDGSFVDAMLLSPEDEEIVRTIIAMAQALRLNVVAERVESRDQAERLRELGCTTLQGYYFHRPASPDAILEHL
ncbi:EAL domain-containing protein [Aquisalimonas lutea]|uniref:bifunctional diguanylate cyclase/phosphodiesterase n=1 Tax=Aquisalimonas lutea TaxID=1327750 RepID=UPI0025B3D209|nr:EAL domain-containing protein [Aquisalimonas lutea]MDN3517994.1 EAL domain-containing protein [Aquisalimonas lutea]